MPLCPLCAKQIDRIKYERVPIFNCGSCGGHWVEKPRLDLILARREVQMPEAVKQKMMDIADASNSRQKLMCLTCGKEMVKGPFKHWPEIQIDRCPKCAGIWLDRGELEKCQIYWEHAKDHPEEWEGAGQAARMALLDAEWGRRKAHLQDVVDRAEEHRRHRHGFGWGLMIGGMFG